MSSSALPSVSTHGAVDRGQEPSFVGRSELLIHTHTTPPPSLLCLSRLPSFCVAPLLLRELPEGGGTVKAVVMLALFKKDRVAGTSQMTCDSYDLFLIILCALACSCPRPPPHAAPPFVFDALNLAVYFPPVCLRVCSVPPAFK